MSKYITFDIENLEPVKISSTIMQSDNEFTRSYISGASIRGAYIANYISIMGLGRDGLNSGIHKEKLLRGKLKFLNGYPIIKEERALPVPKCYFASKEEAKKFKQYKEMSVILTRDESKDDLQRVKGFDFAHLNFYDSTLEVKTIDKTINLHIKLENDRNKLFRYEGIKENNHFRSAIKCQEEDQVQEVINILSGGIFYFGGSKGSGYGKSVISNIKVIDNNPELDFMNRNNNLSEELYNDSGELCIYATSDIIYRNSLGIYNSYIDPEYVKEKLGLQEVEFSHSFVETEYFSGFNNKWGYKLPVVSGIQAGSVLIYTYKGSINSKKIHDFIEEGIGERRQEGFGRFIVLPKVENSLNFRNIIGIEREEEHSKEISLLTSEDKSQLTMLLNRIYLNGLQENIPMRVLERNEKVEGDLKKNQIAKLTNLMDILRGMEYKEGINRVAEYFDNINNKKINRELANSLKKFKIEGILLKDYILNELKNDNPIEFQNKYGHYIKTEDAKTILENEDQIMYDYKLQILKELFRLQLKEEGKGSKK
ncbi:hypothetical protein [Clostridium polynesiense]|uniref:hypothetical protein n=1 Tax=Clostridium polynesiense TaxID=1325933 RepID=UPI00058B9914|nr:hypothetical protein [Clostridium polynesiense]